MKPVKRVRTRASLLVTKLPFSAHATAARVTMYDSINVGSLPGGAAAYAGYVNGKWATWNTLVNKQNKALLLSIDVFGNASLAHCLDVETGDATNGQVLAWFRRMKAAGVPVPVVYTSASNTQAVVNILMGAGLSRSDFLIWSAHYTYSSHICAPGICGEAAADGTQWSDEGPGGCDVSALASYFFPWTLGKSAPTPPPAPPAGPQPLPAPGGLGRDRTKYAVAWEPVKGATGYTVAVFQLNGVKVSETTVTGATSLVLLGLHGGWQYNVEVWANGGPVAPPHATFEITT